MRKITPNYTHTRRKTLVAIGDSLTQNVVYKDLPASLYYPERVAVSLRALSPAVDIKARNFGVSGTTSPQMVARRFVLDAQGPPDLCVIWAGYNDRGALQAISSITRSGTTATVTLASNHGLNGGETVTVSGAVQTDYNITAVIATPTANTFTYTVANSPTSPATGSPIYVIESVTTQANIVTLGNYAIAAGCNQVVVCSRHYVNFAGAGTDSVGGVAQPSPAAGRAATYNADTLAAYNTLVAANPGKVAYANLYAAFYGLLLASPGSAHIGDDVYWHEAVADIHLNPFGEQVVANTISAAVQAQNGWLTALRA